jgi:hypothetical protein
MRIVRDLADRIHVLDRCRNIADGESEANVEGSRDRLHCAKPRDNRVATDTVVSTVPVTVSTKSSRGSTKSAASIRASYATTSTRSIPSHGSI